MSITLQESVIIKMPVTDLIAEFLRTLVKSNLNTVFKDLKIYVKNQSSTVTMYVVLLSDGTFRYLRYHILHSSRIEDL
jgi:predicted ATPase